jgi:hypothetical protein
VGWYFFFKLSLDYYQVKCCMEGLDQKNNITGSYTKKTIIAGHDLPYKIEGKASIETSFGSRDYLLSKDGRTNQIKL